MGAGRLPLASLGPGVGSPWQSRGQTLASALVSGGGREGQWPLSLRSAVGDTEFGPWKRP